MVSAQSSEPQVSPELQAQLMELESEQKPKQHKESKTKKPGWDASSLNGDEWLLLRRLHLGDNHADHNTLKAFNHLILKAEQT
jgi:hypothetical protein